MKQKDDTDEIFTPISRDSSHLLSSTNGSDAEQRPLEELRSQRLTLYELGSEFRCAIGYAKNPVMKCASIQI